ncbi:transcription antitermination factor NusB [Flavobacteriaceae bacterium S356]|uniref:Transcription antitermination factor NusB n=1 Tax=Asprobacillus argus TaxID=3076534 RepID=A0ABU3LG81_9FLAO|nr:transcription antitermination factor NusB [Flavobacteriaceae bacterium S356]
MINRRHIRVKVMQSLYAVLHSENSDIVKEEKFLKHSIKRMFDLYVISLQLLVEVQLLAKQKLEISKKKFLATKEDLVPNTKFVENSIIKILAESNSLKDYIEKHKLDNWKLDDEYVKIVWDHLRNTELFKTYLNSGESSFTTDKNFVVSFFKEIIAPNEKLLDYYEDTTISWLDDVPFVNTWVVRTLHKLNSKGPFVLGSLYKDTDDEHYVSELFKKSILNHSAYEKDIESKTPNWETDRIADLDMILIKMGICEFLNFPSIPTRVTINEYIEISKDYSTKKSSYFINGVLDKLSKDFIESKRLVKVGRGLL